MQNGIYIGTSGWNYKHWSRGVFYPTGLKTADWLPYYAQFYDTVEVNSTFYGLSKREIFEKWREQVPDGFQFTLKAPRFYTHMKKLLDPQDTMAKFLESATGLGDHLSMLLFQLPKGWGFQPERLENLLAFMDSQTIAPGLRSALEIRDESWNNEECFQILRAHHAALVFADWPGFAAEGPVTANFVYLRRHGPWALYASGYPDEYLEKDAEKIRKWRKEGIEAYEYFNNDGYGYAVKNSIRLKEMLGDSNRYAAGC